MKGTALVLTQIRSDGVSIFISNFAAVFRMHRTIGQLVGVLNYSVPSNCELLGSSWPHLHPKPFFHFKLQLS